MHLLLPSPLCQRTKVLRIVLTMTSGILLGLTTELTDSCFGWWLTLSHFYLMAKVVFMGMLPESGASSSFSLSCVVFAPGPSARQQ